MEKIQNIDQVPSPQLILFPEAIERNIDKMLGYVNHRTELLRPHVKTHKLGEVLKLQKARGIEKVKCATIAEMEMAAIAGVKDILLAYQPVGPNMARLLELRKKYQGSEFSAVTDNLLTLEKNAAIIAESGQPPYTFLIDLDTGMHRTGIEPGQAAVELEKAIDANQHTVFGGIHAYDGHIHEADLKERTASFEASRDRVTEFLELLNKNSVSVPKVVAGGSPTFAMHAEFAQQEGQILWECSPGTTVLWDAGYGINHSDLSFEKAAKILTRVISKPGEGRLCLDLGNKSVAAENPIENRIRLPQIPDAKFIGQSEEHLVIETANADDWAIGDELLGIPYHICPSLALHSEAFLVENGKVKSERWQIKARARRITV